MFILITLLLCQAARAITPANTKEDITDLEVSDAPFGWRFSSKASVNVHGTSDGLCSLSEFDDAKVASDAVETPEPEVNCIGNCSIREVPTGLHHTVFAELAQPKAAHVVPVQEGYNMRDYLALLPQFLAVAGFATIVLKHILGVLKVSATPVVVASASKDDSRPAGAIAVPAAGGAPAQGPRRRR